MDVDGDVEMNDGRCTGKGGSFSVNDRFVCLFVRLQFIFFHFFHSFLGHFFFVSLLFHVFFPLNFCISSQALPHSFT